MFFKRGVVKKFRKFHRKTPALESLFNKVVGPQACNLIKKGLQQTCFSVKSVKYLRAPAFTTMPQVAANPPLELVPWL